MGNFYITKQPNFEGKKFKFVGTTIVSWNVSHEQLLSKKNYLIAVIMSTLDEKKCNAAVNVDVTYTDVTKWERKLDDTFYPYNQYGMAVLSFTYGIVSDYKKCEDFTLLSTADAPGKNFVASEFNTFWEEAGGTSDDQISTALTKVTEEIERLATESGYNCAVGFNPDIKPYITPNGEQKCMVSASVTYGTLYE